MASLSLKIKDLGAFSKSTYLFRNRFCDPGRVRTYDPLIKSQMLCQLSYGIMYLQAVIIRSRE